MIESTEIAVLESRWWDNRNTSVRGIFDLVSDIYAGSHHAYKYEMAGNRAGFVEALGRYASDLSTSYLAIACHGNPNGLTMGNSETVTRAVLRNALKRGNDLRTLVGVHFGSCSFCTNDLVEFLYEEDISPWWIAGYQNEVDFVKSTALDFIFFNEVVRRNSESDPVRHIKSVCKYLQKTVVGLAQELGFSIYFKDDKSGRVVDLLHS